MCPFNYMCKDAHDNIHDIFYKKKWIFNKNTVNVYRLAFKTTNLMITSEKVTWKLLKVP